MAIENLIKKLQDIMRQDDGIDGGTQRIAQIVWMLFLKVYDAKEEDWELLEEDYVSLVPEKLKWRNWAVDNKDGEALTGEELLNFINNELFPTLKGLEINEDTPDKSKLVKFVFEDSYNYMKNGVLIRQVLNLINEIDFGSYEERHDFNDIYEMLLKDLQSKDSGEFYTPRSLTDFIISILSPKIGETFRDDACGTGGFIISALEYMKKNEETKWNNLENRRIVAESLRGIEKKPLAYLLATTNLILHDIDAPKIKRDNSLVIDINDIPESEKADVIAMNPPYGGIEEESIQRMFPQQYRTSETADLFMAVIMNKLKKGGRCAVVLPDSFIFGTDAAKKNIKEKLFSEYNLHTIVRLPEGVFAPYTGISSNIVFFNNEEPSNELWIYEHKANTSNGKYTKSKQLKQSDLDSILTWWDNRVESEFAHKVNIEKIKANDYNLNFKNELAVKEEVLEEPSVIIERIEKNMNTVTEKLNILKGLLK